MSYLGRQGSKKPSIVQATFLPSLSGQDVTVGANQLEPVSQNLKTRRTKALVNFALEDFSRIHTQFSEKNRVAYIETPLYSFSDNDRIKFQLRFNPTKHSLSIDALYRGTEPSAQLFFDIYLIDNTGKKYNFDFGRKVECQLSAVTQESNGNFLYDRDDLEKRRDRLFNGDKLVVGVEVNATWIDVTDGLSIME